MLALIAALGRGGVIGVDNKLPWYLPADLRKFKALTLGYPVLMGRKTHDSIGRVLPGRRNIVVSRHQRALPGCEIAPSLVAALQLAGEGGEVFVIGGGEIYRQALPLAQRLYITEVEVDAPGDTFFPPIDFAVWREMARTSHAAQALAPAFTFVTYKQHRYLTDASRRNSGLF